MYVLITLVILGLTIATMIGLRLTQSSVSYSWLASALGALLAWISIIVWQARMPQNFTPSLWAPSGLFQASPAFLVDQYAWLYALSLAALAAAVMLTSPARATLVVNPASWAGTLALTSLGLLAALADNPLTLVLCWSAIDMTEFINTLRASDSPALSERTVISFAVRAAGTSLALWASVVGSASSGRVFLFENTSGQAGFILLIAAGLRLGVLPLHLTFRNEPVLRRGFGTVLRLMTAASSLILLSHLPVSSYQDQLIPYLLLFVALAALYGGWKWLFASDELRGRPYWIIGMSALALAAHLRGSPEGSAAWGSAMVLFGGISFLYSARHLVFTRILAGLGILLLALPFSLTASGWGGSFAWPWLFWPVFITAHLLLVAGYLRHLFRSGETAYADLPTWAQSAYPVGLGLLALTAVLTGVWGWPGALQTGAWITAVVTVLVGGLAGLAVWRFRRFAPAENPARQKSQAESITFVSNLFGRVFWGIYRLLGNLVGLAASLLEGDGGLLWTLLLLVLFITIFGGK
jgi:hypothetical protein